MFFVTPAYAEEAPAGTAETGAATGTDTHAAPAAGDVHTETGVPAEHHGGGAGNAEKQSKRRSVGCG